MLSWHATTTINSSLALGDERFGPKRFAECSITLIVGTAATTWSTALAHDVGGRKNLAEHQGTYLRALARARAQFTGIFLKKEKPMELCLCQRGRIPLSRMVRTLVVLVVLTAEQVPARSRARCLVALASEF